MKLHPFGSVPSHAVRGVVSILTLLSLPVAAPGARAEADVPAAVGPGVDMDDRAMYFLPRMLAGRPLRTTSSASMDPPGTDVDLGGWNETTIAVNPTDPLNIAYASLFELRVTTDGGTTWQPPVPFQVPPKYLCQGDPSVAFDADGRLFCTYLASPVGPFIDYSGIEVLIARCDPATGEIMAGYPVRVSAKAGLPANAGEVNDKAWLAADAHAGSPHANRLYVVWSYFVGSHTTTVVTHSSDQGMNWSTALQLGNTGISSFIWPAHVAVAPDGDVYVAAHEQLAFSGGSPDGVSGQVRVFRSTDGGVTFPQTSLAFDPGEADMTFNVQTAAGPIPGARFLLQGSVQPWLLPDPNVPGRIHVVANDDPDDDITTGDPADVFIATSTDHGATWGTPSRVGQGPGTSFQVMPTAAIDPTTGAIVVHYYDNRNGAVNAAGNFLLDVFASVSVDGGATFGPDFQINDLPFDPDAGARCRANCAPWVTDVWAAGGGNAFAVSYGGDLLEYTGGVWGVVWAAPSLANLGVWGNSPTDVFVCGANGVITHWDGALLVGQSSGTTVYLEGIDGRSGSDVFVVGEAGTVLHYDGISWSPLAPPTVEELHEVWVNPTGSAFVVGRGGTVLRYDGAWTDISPGNGENLFGVWGTGDSDVYAASVQGGLYHWNGASWTPIDLGLSMLAGVWGSSATDILAFGFGRLRHHDGVTWSAEDLSEHLLWKMHGSGPNDVFAVGENAQIFHFDGATWTRQDTPLSRAPQTTRIGEYNGVAIQAGRALAVWCGNTPSGLPLPSQQAIFDRFDTDWLVGVSLYDPVARTPELVLEPPNPNPGRRSITVAYALPRSATVDLALLDVQGRRVATLIHGRQPSGRHVTSWDGGGARALAAGVYVLRLTDGRETRTRKVSLMP